MAVGPDQKPWEAFQSRSAGVGGGEQKPWEAFGGATAPEPPEQNRTILQDLGTDLKRGVQQLPGMVSGLLDIPVAAITGDRYVGKAADALGEATGFQPGKWSEEARQEYSPERQAGSAEIDKAWGDGGAANIAGAYIRNPGNIAGLVAESLPSMVAGGLAGRAALTAGRATGVIAAPATAAQAARQGLIAGAGGEGAVIAGQTMDQIDDSVDARRAAAAAAGAGTLGTAFGYGGGRIAQRMGVIDVDTALAGGRAAVADASGAPAQGLVRRVLGGALTEGAFQELPQSMQEQMWRNWAEGRPVMEGVPRAAVEGTLAGMAMGAGANVLPAGRGTPQADPAAGQAPDDTTRPPVQPASGPLNPEAQQQLETQAPTKRDFEAALREEVEPQIIIDENGRPKSSTSKYEIDLFHAEIDGRIAKRQQNIEAGKRLQDARRPSEQMGLDPNAGTMSAAAALAVDSGASQQFGEQVMQQEAEALPNEHKGEQTPRERDYVPPPAGSFSDMNDFAELLGQERHDVEGRRQQIGDMQTQRQAFEFEEADRRTAQGMQREAQARRRAVLDAVLEDPETVNPAERFAATLQRTGFRDAAPTEDELATIQRFEDVRAAQPPAPQIEPSAPNELDAASMGIRERQPPALPEPIEAVGDRWDTLAPTQRAAMLNEAGGWNARNGSLNVIGKNLAGKEWSSIPEGVRSKVTQLLQAAPRADAVVPAAQPQGAYDGAIPTDDLPDAAVAAPGAAQAGDYMGPSAGAASQQLDVPAAGGMEPAAASVVGGRVPGESAGVESAGRSAVAPDDGSPAGQALRILIERTDGNGSPDGLAGPENADARTAIVAAITGQSVAEIEAAPNYKFRTSVPQVERLLYDAAGIPAGNLKDRRAPFLDWLDTQTGQQAPAQGKDSAEPFGEEGDQGPQFSRGSAFTPDAYDAKQYAAAVDRIAAMPAAPRTDLTIGDTPAVLRVVGAKPLPMQMPSSVVQKASRPEVRNHDVPVDVIKNIPFLIADPVLVYESPTERGALVAVVDAKDKSGRAVIVAVHLDVRGSGFHNINKIASIYGKDDVAGIEKAMQGSLRYYNNEKAAQWLRAVGLQLPEANTIKRLNPDVTTQLDVVKFSRSLAGHPSALTDSLAPTAIDGAGFTELARSYRARGITPDTLREAIAGQFPSLSRGLERMLERGQKGEKGGLVVIDSTHERDIAEVFAQKTRRPLDEVVRYFSDAEGINGFFDPRSGITFMVGPNLTAQSAPAVLLHEMVHSQQRANIDARSMALIEGRGKNVVRPMRELLNRVADRMARAGESGNASEATAYIVEEAVLLGRQAGFSVVDGPFMDFVDARISRRIGDILRDVVAMVRAWSLRHGAGLIRLTVDDLVAYAKAGVDLAGRGDVQTKTEGGTRASTSGDALLARKVEAVNLHLRGWSGTREQLRALASGWYSDNLQGRRFKNADMDVDVLFTSEGKGTAFATSGNLRVGWRAEMVRALPELISRAVKVAESEPDARRTKDTRAFHTLLSPLVVNNKPYTAKITVREALAGPVPRHKFYDLAALEIESGPEVSGLKDPGINILGPLPTPSEPRSFTVGELAAAVNGLGLAGDAPQFSRAGRGIDAAPTGDIGASPEKMAVSDWLSHQLKNARGWAMGALTRDQIADLFGRDMPQVRRFDEVVQNMDATRQTISQEADVLIERWRQLPGPLADRLADLMHQATIGQFDPDTANAPANAAQVEIQQQWNALPVPVQNLYREVRDSYTRTLGAIRDSLADRAERASSTGAQVAAKIRLEFDKHLAKGPYFPLARFGDLMLIAKKNGETRVETFESSFRREQRKRMLEANGWTVKQTRRQEYAASRDGSASEFVSKVIEKIDSTNMPADQKASLLDSLNQMAINLLPSASYRQHFAHRKGTPGFSTDAMRAFASSMQHAAHHIARIRHAHELSILLDEMQKGIREAHGAVDVTLQQEVVNELTRRLDYLLKPNTHPVAAAAGQVGFVMSLGGSVAAGLVNLTQTPMVTLPWLGSKHGFTKAAEAITKASKDYFSGKWEKWSGFVLTSSPNLNSDEKAAIQQLEASGLISLTQSSDLAGTANTDSTVSQRAWAINRAMKVVGWTFHVPEVFNRQVSALAAYRLAREAGRDHAAAVEEARITLIRTHFDYAASNRARWMQGNFTRVITMFKQYSQQMTYLLWRNAYQALKGENPEVKREARRMLVGVGAMHFAAAGSLGLPLGVFGISPLLSLLAMGMGDEDDPYDWEAEYRNMLADTFGQDMGEAIAKGPLRMLLNVDFASRVGLGDLWIRPPSKEAEGRDLVESWMLTLLGPVAGYVGQMGTAAKAFDEGKYARGVESMVPKFIASPLKAARFEQEGVRSWRGDDLGIDLTPADIFGVALGFQPSRMAEMYEGRAAVKGRESRLQGRRQEILNMWVAAYMAGDQFGQMDAVQAAQRFGEKNPSFAITGAAFRQAYRSKMRNAAQIRDGIHLSPKRDSLRDEGRFAGMGSW